VLPRDFLPRFGARRARRRKTGRSDQRRPGGSRSARPRAVAATSSARRSDIGAELLAARAPGAPLLPQRSPTAEAQPSRRSDAGDVRAGDRSGAKRRRSGHRVTRPPLPVAARTANRPDPSGRVRGPPRAPGLTDPAERDGVETKEREPPADQRERARRPAARPKASATVAARRRLRRARQPAGRSGGPGHSTAGATTRANSERGRRRGSYRSAASRGPLHRAGRPPGPTARLPHAAVCPQRQRRDRPSAATRRRRRTADRVTERTRRRAMCREDRCALTASASERLKEKPAAFTAAARAICR